MLFKISDGTVHEHKLNNFTDNFRKYQRKEQEKSLEELIGNLSLSESEPSTILLEHLKEADLPCFIRFVEEVESVSFDAVIEIISGFQQFTRLEAQIKAVLDVPQSRMDWFKDEVCKKFPLLVLIDLGGTLFYRTSDRDAKGLNFSTKITKYFYFFRPGHIEFLTALYNHPRITLGYYSSIMARNILPALTQLLVGKLKPLAEDPIIFDQDFCPLMKDHPYMKDLLTDPWDRYRDLEQVWKAEVLEDENKKPRFGHNNTLVIDSDAVKV